MVVSSHGGGPGFKSPLAHSPECFLYIIFRTPDNRTLGKGYEIRFSMWVMGVILPETIKVKKVSTIFWLESRRSGAYLRQRKC